MQKIMKRGFCLFLVAVLLAGLVPCAFADEAMPTGEVEASEAATEAAEETTAPPETEVPSESIEPPSETTEPPEATETTESETEVTEPEADPVEDAPEDAVEDDRLAAYASTVTNVLLFDKASPNYTTVLRSQVSVTYNPNGSDAAKTAYVIKVLDLINPERSHCYNPFVYLRDDDDIQRLATNIMKNTTPKDSKSSDHFWEDMAAMLLKALISYLHYEAPTEEQNFPMVMDMIRAGDVKEDNEEYVSTLDELFERLERKNPEHIAVRYYKGYHSGSGKTLKSIQITLISHLEKFNLTSLAGITQTDEMELGEIGERKTAVFAVIPDSDSSYNFIVGMLYTQLFQQLYRKADFEHGGRLPVHVHFVMDEFANVALPDDFDKLLATMRSREISVSIILQNLAQLKALFDKQWESIVGNCDTFLYLGGNEQSTHEYVSKLLGKQTIDTNTYGHSKGRSGSYTTNFQTAGRELMTPDEVRMLDNRYALLFIRGERPVKDLKYNILKHPNVALTTDGKAVAYQHGTDPLSVAAVSINLEKLKQAIPEDTDTGDYVVLTEEEVYDFMRKKAQENNQNQNSNKQQEVTYEKHHPQHHSSHHPSDF